MRKSCGVAIVCAFIGVLQIPTSADAQEAVIYACTRRFAKGVTQTYIAPLKNGIPVCNNAKHKGPFQLLDLSTLSIPGAPGANGKDGVNGKDGANGKDGLNGKDGKDGAQGIAGATGPAGPQGAPVVPSATVSGSIRSCHLAVGEQEYNNGFREAHCVLNGTATFSYYKLFGTEIQGFQSEATPTVVTDDSSFTFANVPAGEYTLDCSIERPCSGQGFGDSPFALLSCLSRSFYRSSYAVTVPDTGLVTVDPANFCDADGDGTLAETDCNDADPFVGQCVSE